MAFGLLNPYDDAAFYNNPLYDRLGLQKDHRERQLQLEMSAMKQQAYQEAAMQKPVPPPEPNKVLLLLGEDE